jgi:hypothetical protein
MLLITGGPGEPGHSMKFPCAFLTRLSSMLHVSSFNLPESP